jgi:hypothetical protein
MRIARIQPSFDALAFSSRGGNPNLKELINNRRCLITTGIRIFAAVVEIFPQVYCRVP